MPKSVLVAISTLAFLLILNIVWFFQGYVHSLWKAPVIMSVLLEGMGLLVLAGLVLRKKVVLKVANFLAPIFLAIVIFFNFGFLVSRTSMGLDWWLIFGFIETSIVIFIVALSKSSTRDYFLKTSDKNG